MPSNRRIVPINLASQVMKRPEWGDVRVQSIAAQALVGQEATLAVLNIAAQVAIRADHRPGGGRYSIAHTPFTEDTRMLFHDLIFPECIAYGSTGVPRYETTKTEVDSGAEQRNSRSEYPRHEYNIAIENMNAQEIAQVMNLWHVCAGDFIGFLFMDPLDHTSAMPEDGPISAMDVSATDQFVASALGTKSSYELFKTYKQGIHEKVRRILYPKKDTLVVAIDGKEHRSWAYSYDTHKLTFLNSLAPTTAALTMTNGLIEGMDFGDIKEGDLVYITGWDSGGYSISQGGDPARVTTTVNDGSGNIVGITLETYAGNAITNNGNGAAVTIQTALPPTGAEITAGFYFYVPVRFENGDNAEVEVKSGMYDSAFADFNQIRLREIYE